MHYSEITQTVQNIRLFSNFYECIYHFLLLVFRKCSLWNLALDYGHKTEKNRAIFSTTHGFPNGTINAI